ncbi:MAG: hypothetical protein HYS25_01000 [Ignavibacteriales bacterium]|nr:hypothetical protein [Ignavibacteriales bacterium]
MQFGEKLKTWVVKEFGTVTKGADAFGMAQGDLSKIIIGKRKPGLNFFITIAKYKPPFNWFFSPEEGYSSSPDDASAFMNYLTKQLKDKQSRIAELESIVQKQNSDLKVFDKITKYFQKK